MAEATVLAVAAAFIALGLLNIMMPLWTGGLNWMIAGAVAVLVGFGGHKLKKK